MPKTPTIQEFIDDSIKEIFGQERGQDTLFQRIKDETAGVVRSSVDKFVLSAFGLEHRWSEWEIKEEKFAMTRIGQYIFSDVQDAVIKELGQVNPAAVASQIEKTVQKYTNGIIDELIHKAVREQLEDRVEQQAMEIIDRLVKAKVDKMIQASLAEVEKKAKEPLFQAPSKTKVE